MNTTITRKPWPNKLGVDFYEKGKRVFTIECNALSMQQMSFHGVWDDVDWTKEGAGL